MTHEIQWTTFTENEGHGLADIWFVAWLIGLKKF